MNDTAIDQLMHDVLDGVASADEKARLEQQLAADPVLRQRFAELEGMFDTLNRVPMVDAPEDLHAELMRTIERGKAAPAPPSGFFAAFAEMFRARPVPAFAMTALAIVALAVVLWSGAGQRGLRIAGHDSPVTGTMAPPAAADVVSLEAGEARIRIEMERRDEVVIATLTGHAPSGAALDFAFAGIASDVHASLEGQGAAIDETASVSGRIRTNLKGTVRARLRIEAGGCNCDIETTLLTLAGTDRHLFTSGREPRP